ncbi:hypothetical protein M9H77_08762 [Catharanthus roseus]|uniref:Uncharacterized protein n=1 Tax=Catharanthus roseus TaxID=4058 RepID=A0ACC0BYL6_CATRO|nr:hypothetical protein M9H77_08762 [Catharanthus roseus]
MAHPSHRWTYREGTLVDEPSRTTSSSSSSYSLREIVPEKETIPVIDLSDDESVEGPEMTPVAPGIGLGTSIEEDPSEPTSDSKMTPEPERVAPAFIAQFLGTTRDSVDRARDELESRPGCSGSQCPQAENMSSSQSPNHADKAVSESSQKRQSEPMREATPRPKQATHKLNDIYDTLKYEDTLRVMFAAFRLRGMAKDRWLRAFEARTLKNQPWIWNDFQEEFKREYIPHWVREQREDDFQ